MRIPVLLHGLAAVSALLHGAALAQETAEPEIVVTAPLEGARIESLQGATSLTRDDIVETLNNGLGDTLDAQPGVASTFFGAGASRPIIRGLGEDRVRVLQNGIGAIDASTASPDHAVTSDGLDAERIEVLRGAAALAYGGNAIGGVVNVLDQSIPTRAAAGVRFSGLAAASSVDDGANASANVGFGAASLAFDLSLAAREADPYRTPHGVALNQFTSMRAYGAGASLVRDWGFSGFAVKQTQSEYGLLPEDASEPGGHIELEQTRLEARGDLQFDRLGFNRFDYAFQRSDYEHTEFEGDGSPATRFRSEGWEGRLETHYRGERLRGAAGAQFSDVTLAAEGGEAFISPTDTRDLGVFAVTRWDDGEWGLEGGARLERRELSNAALGARDFNAASASIGAFLRPAEDWFVAATLARTERAPTAVELFSDGPHLATANYEVGDPDLAKESAFSFEASARYGKDRVAFEANVYSIGFDDYVALVARGDIFWIDELTDTSGFAPDPTDPSVPPGATILPVFHQVQRDATFVGGEISATATVFAAGGFAISADVALDIVRAEFEGGGHPPRIPPLSITVGAEAETEHWTARVEAVSTGRQDRLAEFETATDGFTLMNASVAFRPGGQGGAWALRLDGRNLTDEEGRVHSSFLKDELHLPGRNIRLTATTSF